MSLARRVEELLRPGGRLASRWPGYEDRPAQRRMAVDMARTFEQGGVLLAEAPTGIGKSLGYLLPGVLAAVEGRKLVIATCTKSLQDQLFERDLPVLLEASGNTVRCARLKGKQNYLCPVALETTEGAGAEEREALEQLRRWAAEEETGDLDRFPATDGEAFRRLRGRVAADPAACTTATCRRGRECFWVRARRRATAAGIVVVNHALLALASEADGLLPAFDLLVVDEAHRLEGVLLSQVERGLSRTRFEDALRLIGAGRARRAGGQGGGLAARVRGRWLPLFDERLRAEVAEDVDALGTRVGRAREDVEEFFRRLAPPRDGHELYGVRERYRSASELFGRDLGLLETLLQHCFAFSSGLSRWSVRLPARELEAGRASPAAEDLAAELDHAAALWGALGADLENLAQAANPGWVYWRTAGGRGVELRGSPVTVGDAARRLVTGRAEAAVLTSATLSAAGEFRFAAERLGLGESEGCPYTAISYPSPFPLERQMKVFVWTDRAREEAEVVAGVVTALAERTTSSQLVLFTAHERLRRAREILRGRLPRDRPLIAQEWDGSTSRVSERFRARRGAVLLGVQSLWEGVDFPGATLEILIVAKLPFSVPDDPLVEARGERLMERGLDPFRDDALPEAVLRFRQGVGRLIRRSDDRGVLVVCDARLARASYRSAFLGALPVPPRPARDEALLAAEAAAFLEAPDPFPVGEEA